MFPNSDLRTAKRRPAVVVQSENADTGIAQVVLAMLTSQLSRRGRACRVFIAANSPEGRAAGLLCDSVILADNLSTLRLDLLERAIGHLVDLSAVDAALRHTLAL
jgi:mRNA interferase MazF